MGIVWDIRKYTLHDGPGIRTTVFLKGCPLNCRWCSNPESQDPHPQLIWLRERCLACGRCGEACPNDAVSFDRSAHPHRDRLRCRLCGTCVERCPAEAAAIVGREMSVDDVLHEVGKDAIFYHRSGGGLTLSGGEPLAQSAFASELLRRYRSDYVGFHTTVETCGYADWRDVALLVPHTDLFLYDIKHMDPVVHWRLTGASNDRILENAVRIVAAGGHLVVRIPLIPGVNDDEANLGRTADFARTVLRVDRVDVLPYHRLGEPKYARIGRQYPLEGVQAPASHMVSAARALLERCGMQVHIGG